MSELERALTAVGRNLDLPEAPDLVPAVMAQLGSRSAGRPERRRWILAVALVAVAAFAATLAIPDARSALFRFLSIGGERIELVDSLPEVPAQDDLELALVERVTLEEARRIASSSSPLRELDKPPDRVYAGERGTVWFLYGSPTRARLLVAQSSLLPPGELLRSFLGLERVELGRLLREEQACLQLEERGHEDEKLTARLEVELVPLGQGLDEGEDDRRDVHFARFELILEQQRE